jgi:predicted nucleic acid-binding protein
LSYLLDTNVVSELRKRSPHANVAAWYDGVPSSELFLSCLTIGEVRLGIEVLRRKDKAQAAVLDRWLATLHTIYRDRIVAVDNAIAEQWGELNVSGTLPVIDSLLAATAMVWDWTLVSRNTADLCRTGARLLNPFEFQG